MAKKRVTVVHLPQTPIKCPVLRCVYNDNKTCEDVRIYKGNGDATCHKWNNKDLLLILKIENPDLWIPEWVTDKYTPAPTK